MYPTDENSLKDWEELFEDFRFLFRYGDQLVEEGWMNSAEFLEEFFSLIARATRLLNKK